MATTLNKSKCLNCSVVLFCLFIYLYLNYCENYMNKQQALCTPRCYRAIGSTQWTNTFEPKILKYIIKKMPLCQIILLAQSYIPVNQHWPNYQKLAVVWLTYGFVQARWYDKVAFFIISMIYFIIYGSKVLVHWVEPIARFRQGVYEHITITKWG